MNTPTASEFTPLFATRPACSPAIRDLHSFNSAPAEQLTTLLTFMTASRELARTVVVGRPYLTPLDLYAAASRTLHTLPTPLIQDIVNSHQPIDRVPLIENAMSSGELSTDRVADLRDAALGYATVQGHLFIADPRLWGSAEAVAMIPTKDGAHPDMSVIVEHLLADVDERMLLIADAAWQLTVSHLEESNRLKLVTLVPEQD